MQKFNFSETYKEAEKQYNLGEGTGKFKPEDGQNKIRLMSVCLAHPGEYKGQKTFKWLCHVLDRKDNKIKPYFMPVTVYRAIESLQASEDFTFDSVPMPYDIVLNVKNAGDKSVEYSVIPTKETKLTKEEEEMLSNTPDIKEIQDKIYEKNGHPGEMADDNRPSVDEVPFG